MSGERTEAPTQKRLDDARAKGDVARSRDLVSFAALAAAFAVAAMTAESSLARLRVLVRTSVVELADPASVDPSTTLIRAATETAALVLPILLATLIVGVGIAFVDAGPVFAPQRIAPDLTRLDPAKGFSQLFSKDRFVELGKSSLVLVALIAVSAVVLRDLAPTLPRLVTHGVGMSLAASGEALTRTLTRFLAVLAALAALDVVLSRKQFTASMRMTKDEVRREYKESDGDPHQKGERARMHREILEHSVLENVRRADVLVVNPTHLAVALRFDADSDQNAPEVLGKGEDELAQRMIAVAREAGVPVLRDIPLARSLHELDLGDEIPAELYEAVAAVLRAAWDEREDPR